MLSQLRVLELDNFNLMVPHRAHLRRFFRAMSQPIHLQASNSAPNIVLRSLLDAGAAAMPELRVVRFWENVYPWADAARGQISDPLLKCFLQAFPRARCCLAPSSDAIDNIVRAAAFASWPRVCTAINHAPPDSDGLSRNCSQSCNGSGDASSNGLQGCQPFDLGPPVDVATVENALAAEWIEVGGALGEAKQWTHGGTQQRANRNPFEPPSASGEVEAFLTTVQSLRAIEAEYRAALKIVGPWVRPPRPWS